MSALPHEPLIGRLAPSPTGELHLGHARSFLLAWWSIRSRGGRLLLRLEDLDGERSRPEFIEGILTDLTWLGMNWDGEPIVQSEGLAAIRAQLDALIGAGRVYPCTCTRREVREAARAPHADGEAGAYAGTCRERFASLEEAEAKTGRRPALRFRVTHEPVRFCDLVLGDVEVNLERKGGDFVVARSDGLPAYQLAVVVDDASSGVTEVLRGEDLKVSCARQALLHDALSLPRPTWAHVPLVHDQFGERLAKRAGSLSLSALREAGIKPSQVVAWAAASSGLPQVANNKSALPEDYLAVFDLRLLPAHPITAPVLVPEP